MKVEWERHGDATAVAVITGSLNALTATELEGELIPVAREAKVTRLVLDLSGVAMVSSAGLRVLLTAIKEMRAHSGEVCMAGLGAANRKIFEMVGFFNFSRECASVADALDG